MSLGDKFQKFFDVFCQVTLDTSLYVKEAYKTENSINSQNNFDNIQNISRSTLLLIKMHSKSRFVPLLRKFFKIFSLLPIKMLFKTAFLPLLREIFPSNI